LSLRSTTFKGKGGEIEDEREREGRGRRVFVICGRKKKKNRRL